MKSPDAVEKGLSERVELWCCGRNVEQQKGLAIYSRGNDKVGFGEEPGGLHARLRCACGLTFVLLLAVIFTSV
jgi:hypothetical protein